MGPSRRVLMCAISMLMAVATWTGAVRAQEYESILRTVGYFPDPLARSPRLMSMGRLTLASDVHNGLNIWDFAGNPLGVASAESISTFEMRPLVRAASSVHDLPGGTPPRERQDLALRQVRNGVEAWRRAPGSGSYGVIGEFSTFKLDVPSSEVTEARSKFSVPALAAVINGPLVWIPGNRAQYAVRIAYNLEIRDHEYFDIYHLPQGDYIGRRTDQTDPPDIFTPDHSEVSSLAGGVGISYAFGRALVAGVMVDKGKANVKARNLGLRSESRINEERPITSGELSLSGRLGDHLEWIADGRGWKSHSEEFFLWSISAGTTQLPLSGSGKRLDRDEEGSAVRTRVRWTSGSIQLDGGINTSYRRTIITPWYPPSGGPVAGFNDFLDQIGFRTGADTLMLPARLVDSRIESRGVELAGGLTWHSSSRRLIAGTEFHHRKLKYDQIGIGEGPVPTAWDVRAGAELHLNSAVSARGGYVYGRDDADDLAAADTDLRRAATAGLGFQPLGSRWTADLAYAFEWVDPDFGDPTKGHGTRQEFGLQLRWPF